MTAVLQLSDAAGSYQRRLYRVSRGCRLRLTLAPHLEHVPGVAIATNCPLPGPASASGSTPPPFSRADRHLLPWQTENANKETMTDVYCELCPAVSGSFDFFLSFGDAARPEIVVTVLVDPVLRLGDTVLPLDAIAMQTVLSPCMGPVTQWVERLRVASQCRYNMVHFTPIQVIGQSRSAYSLRSHLELDPRFKCTDSEELAKTLAEIRRPTSEGGLGMLCVVDVVWNHTATDSDWLQDHPEAGYSLANSPHLKPAFVLDAALQHYSRAIAGTLPVSKDDIQRLLDSFWSTYSQKMRLWEFYVVDVDAAVAAISARLQGLIAAGAEPQTVQEVVLRRDPDFGRFSQTVDLEATAPAFVLPRGHEDDAAYFAKCVARFKQRLEERNLVFYEQVNHIVSTASMHIGNTLRYERLDGDGPNRGPVSATEPLVSPYFSFIRREQQANITFEHCPLEDVDPAFIVAHNGWIWGGSSLVDFAGPESSAYVKREVIVWCDSVKLRYGDSPESNPWIWGHMLEYTKAMAGLFDGLRIDNCHSTPLHVGQYLLDAARSTNGNLFVMAELFTNSVEEDNEFCNKLGLTTLIREAMSANSPGDFSQILHRFGGQPIGSFRDPSSKFFHLEPTVARAMFMDQTHDNVTATQKYTVHNALPLAALVAMECNASGSTRGYDVLLDKPVEVVGETRLFSALTSLEGEPPVEMSDGILRAKAQLNALHERIAKAGFDEYYLHFMSANIMAITRQCPMTLRGVVLVAHLAFSQDVVDSNQEYTLPPVNTNGKVVRVCLLARPGRDGAEAKPGAKGFVSGFRFGMEHLEDLAPQDVPALRIGKGENGTDVFYVDRFPPGSVVAVEVEPMTPAADALKDLRHNLGLYDTVADRLSREAVSHEHLENGPPSGPALESLQALLGKMSLLDLNYVLYRCEKEEETPEGAANATFDIPEHGRLLYCGLQGLMSLLETVRAENNLGHPVCKNLRLGDWLGGYTADRLDALPSTKPLGQWLRKHVLAPMGKLPRSSVPAWFTTAISLVYTQALKRAWSGMSPFVQAGDTLTRALALNSVVLYGMDGRHARGPIEQEEPSLAAGLPHFAAGWMRSWGRDAFISLRGLLLVTGRFQDARQVLLFFASVSRHGLIPNLLDGGRNPRFNCRDAAWWFLQALQDYVALSPEGAKVLEAPVTRKFHLDKKSDHDAYKGPPVVMKLSEVVQEIMSKHVHGISYREWNAGCGIDSDMPSRGFNVSVEFDRKTGFISGGSSTNCGTWMDKMGSSTMGGNKGFPSTPRDGADVEIIGLLKSTVDWLATLHAAGQYPYKGVDDLTYKAWGSLLKKSFEAWFWVPLSAGDDAKHHANPALVHRRGIYKDTVGATAEYADYQLRPNCCVAMAVAPQLFEADHARQALKTVEEALVGGMGMRTLDPQDHKYRPNYYNQNDSIDFATAKGANYHQGPEWVWCVGYFLRAKYRFAEDTAEAKRSILEYCARYKKHIFSSPWKGIPELCNENGSHCADSCPLQAWSASCLLDALFDMSK